MKKKMISLVFAAAFVMQVVLPAAAEEDLLESGTIVEEEYMETGRLDDSESGNVDEQDNKTVSDEDVSWDLEDTNESEPVFEEFEIPDEPAANNLLNEELLVDDLSSEEDILIIYEESQMEAELIDGDISGSENGLLESGNTAEEKYIDNTVEVPEESTPADDSGIVEQEPADDIMMGTEGTVKVGVAMRGAAQGKALNVAVPAQTVPSDIPKIKHISVDQTHNSVILKWTQFSGASYFEIRRYEASPDGTVVSKDFYSFKANINQYTDTNGLVRNKVYKYVIYAFNSSGKKIGAGETFIIKINTPSVTSISVLSEDSVCIRWKQDAYATGYVLDYVEGDCIGSYFKTEKVYGDSTSYIVEGLEPGAVYTFRLSTEQEGRTGKYRSARVYKTIKMPEIALKTFKAPFTGWINKDKGIYFTWEKTGKVDGFRIFRRENRESTWNCIAKVNSNTTSFTDTSTEIGKKYYYSVVGYTGSREFSYKTGMSESKALVRLTKPETYAVYKDNYVLVVYAFGEGSNVDSIIASDYLFIETTDRKGKRTTSYVKKDVSGIYYFSVKNMVSARVRYCKIYNNCIYPGTWSNKIDIKKSLVSWRLK